MTRFSFLITALFLTFFLTVENALAQSEGVYSIPGANPDEEGAENQVSMPTELSIAQVKFMALQPPSSFQDRVDRLVQGIKINVAPEYDHYGYEMRRYMAGVGNPAVYGDPNRLAAEIENVRKAKIIFEYWQKALFQEINDISKIIESKKDVSTNARSTLKYNQGVIAAFFIECQSWLDNNERLLKFIEESQGSYVFSDMQIFFKRAEDFKVFVNLTETREKARTLINQYSPFAAMVY